MTREEREKEEILLFKDTVDHHYILYNTKFSSPFLPFKSLSCPILPYHISSNLIPSSLLFSLQFPSFIFSSLLISFLLYPSPHPSLLLSTLLSSSLISSSSPYFSTSSTHLPSLVSARASIPCARRILTELSWPERAEKWSAFHPSFSAWSTSAPSQQVMRQTI